MNATFDWIAANLRDEIDFVVWTGDTARHDSDEEIPRNRDQVLGTNRLVADKMADTFADRSSPSAAGGLAVPVVPTLGNNDILPHNILLPGPNRWLRDYGDIWRRFIPEEQRHSFEFGGWFYVEVIPDRLAVFSLNTLYWFDRNAGVDDCVDPGEPGYKQMEWLRVQLQFLRSRGMKALLIGHVPPARTESKVLWHESCWQKYTLWLRQFRDVVVGAVFGHMNIDHFMLQDTEDVDIRVVEGSSAEFGAREAMDDELTVQGAANYLQELRIAWSNLVKPTSGGASDEGHRKEKKKKKKPADPWAERYQLSLVSPSLVPNYFPTLRVFEYNISGLQNAAVWQDALQTSPTSALVDGEDEVERDLDLRDLSEVNTSKQGDKKKGRKKKHKKPKDKKPPKDPHLVIPEPPAKSAPPGPAYSPQPLTLTAYTQYFANLTYINNDLTTDDPEKEQAGSSSVLDWLLKWRKGKHGDEQPKRSKPKPRELTFEVEYNTMDDKLYRLSDLTVGSFVKLASKMVQPIKRKELDLAVSGNDTVDAEERIGEEEEGANDAADDDSEEDAGEDVESADDDDEVDAEKKEQKGGVEKQQVGNDKKKGQKQKAKKVWLHFLKHAFVSTAEKDDLKKIA